MKCRTNINHRCPNCGKVLWKSMSAGWVRRDATCQTCGTTYTLTREMHESGLSGRTRSKANDQRHDAVKTD